MISHRMPALFLVQLQTKGPATFARCLSRVCGRSIRTSQKFSCPQSLQRQRGDQQQGRQQPQPITQTLLLLLLAAGLGTLTLQQQWLAIRKLILQQQHGLCSSSSSLSRLFSSSTTLPLLRRLRGLLRVGVGS
jgi:hypothetical protein